ncbi:MAG: hypothetical protein R2845_08340 [Thermomicrobiales bacterium]
MTRSALRSRSRTTVQGTAYDVVMTDVLPANIDWDAVANPACSVTDGTLTCEWDEIASAARKS